jgi:hypothetical protein
MMTDVMVETEGNAIAIAFPFSNDLSARSAAQSNGTDGAKQPKVPDEYDSAKFILWGEDNMWPQKAWKEIESNDVAPMVLDWKKRALISGGLIFGARYIEDGVEKFKQLMLDEVDTFLENSCVLTNYLPASAHNIYTYKSFFPYFVMNRANTPGQKKIKELYTEDPHHIRMGRQEGRLNHINKVWVSGRFGESEIDPPDLKDHPAVDRYGNIDKQLRNAKSKIYYPIYTRINGNVAYEIPAWYGLKKSKWLELAKHIPIWKAALMANAASIKYQFIIHQSYWERKYKDSWEKMTDEERHKKKREEIKNALKALTGTEKAGNALWTEQIFDELTDKYIPLWQIERIDNTKQGGDYIEDSQEADFHIIRAFGVDPTLIGQTPGAKMGAGSGSDKRVAFNHYMLLCKPEQDALLEPLHWAARFNGWHELAQKASGQSGAKLTFRLRNYHIAKLELGQEVAPAENTTNNGDKKEDA